MLRGRRPWREELEIVDRTMRAISGVTDPQQLVDVYWEGIGDLVSIEDYVAVSRRGVQPPFYLVTRSSRFTEEFNPWTQRDRLPRLSGGVLGEIAYANRPVLIEDLPARLAPDDPGRFYLEGFQQLVALPQYDAGEGLNVTSMLLRPGVEIDRSVIPILHWQSGLFGRGTQNLVLRNQLSGALAALDRELQVVGEIQRSLLPPRLPEIPGFEVATHYLTSARAGGDYYDFFPLAGGRWGVLIADVSGHGTPAAVMMAITHAIAHSRPDRHRPPGALLDVVNDELTRAYTRNGTFVTAFYGVLDPESRSLTYAAAGHPPPRLVRDGRAQALDGVGSLPMGISGGVGYAEATVQLRRGDLLLLYTDGITEAMAPAVPGGAPDLFGTGRLDALLTTGSAGSAQNWIDRLRTEVGAFTGDAPASDDQSVVAVRCL